MSAEFIQTIGGARLVLSDPQYKVTTTQMGLVLARQPRFSGHWREDIDWYSVAQHSVIVAAGPGMSWDTRLMALTHDAHEPFWGFGDVARPAKSLFLHCDLREYENKHAAAARVWAGAFRDVSHADVDWAAIHKMDNVALLTERRDLLDPPQYTESWDIAEDLLPQRIRPLAVPPAARNWTNALQAVWNEDEQEFQAAVATCFFPEESDS